MKKKIALLTSGWTVDYITSLISGMKHCCEQNNLDLCVFTCYKFMETTNEANTTSFTVFDLINYEDYLGIIITPNVFNDEEMVQKYAKKILDSKVPAVSVGCPLEGFHYINTDNTQAIKDCINHIIKEHNVKTYAFICGPKDSYDSNRNFEICQKVFEENGMSKEKSLRFTGYTDWSFTTAFDEIQKMVKSKKIPDAIVCINHSVAMAAIDVATENGIKVPDDIIIVGFDDAQYSTKVLPSLSTINLNVEQMGEEAINILVNQKKDTTSPVVNAEFVPRQSCGCHRKITAEQVIYSQNIPKILEIEQRFTSQLRFLEDRFLKSKTISDLYSELQKHYQNRHFFEGPDFAICVDEKVIDNISETLTERIHHTSYGKTMQTIANLQNGIPVKQRTFPTTQLIPQNLQDKKSCMYLILPIFNQKNVYGYYISKNYTGLLTNKAAYNWTRNLGTCIEKYRRTSVYRRMSEQLQILSTQDALSGLLNRAGLHTYAEDLFMNNQAKKKSTEIIFVDINRMKIINDKFGHLQGDLAIKTVAEAISSAIPEKYIAVRYGGDEFVIIGTATGKVDYCKKIAAQLSVKADQMALPFTLTASMGAKTFKPEEVHTLAEAINAVDKIMYQKKQAYHNSH